jgi:hypothetical protein
MDRCAGDGHQVARCNRHALRCRKPTHPRRLLYKGKKTRGERRGMRARVSGYWFWIFIFSSMFNYAAIS